MRTIRHHALNSSSRVRFCVDVVGQRRAPVSETYEQGSDWVQRLRSHFELQSQGQMLSGEKRSRTEEV